LQKHRWNKDFLRARHLLATRKRGRKKRARAAAARSNAIRSRVCAQQKNFAQSAAREGAEGPESIKKERISAK
jgi:hypothetical protein